MTHWLNNVRVVRRPLWVTTAAVLRYDTIRVKDHLNKKAILRCLHALRDESAIHFPESVEHKGKSWKIMDTHIMILLHELWHCVQRRKWGFCKYARYGSGSFTKKHESYIESQAHEKTAIMIQHYKNGGIPAVRRYLTLAVKPNTP